MKNLKINNYNELEKIKEFKENEFIIDLSNSNPNQRKEIISFLAGLTFLKGSLKKVKANEFEVKIVR